MHALQDAGRNVPEQVSVVGFDDIQSAAFHRPALTTVRQPLHRMGEKATRILLDRLSGKSTTVDPEHVVLEPQLMIRDSTAPAAKSP